MVGIILKYKTYTVSQRTLETGPQQRTVVTSLIMHPLVAFSSPSLNSSKGPLAQPSGKPLVAEIFVSQSPPGGTQNRDKSNPGSSVEFWSQYSFFPSGPQQKNRFLFTYRVSIFHKLVIQLPSNHF